MAKKTSNAAVERAGEKNETKICGCGCGKEGCTCETTSNACGCGCNCGCQGAKKGTSNLLILLSAALVSGAIVAVPHFMPPKASLSSQVKSSMSEQVVEDYIKTHPDVISDTIENYKVAKEEAEKLAQIQSEKEALERITQELTSDNSMHSLGNPSGNFVIFEFFDYRCIWCRRTNKALWEAIDSGKAPNIRWVPVDSPIFGADSVLISKFVMAAGKQGKFQEMHHAVVDLEGDITKDVLIKKAEALGLDKEQLLTDVESEELTKKIESNMRLAQELGVSGVPFLIINGEKHPGALLGEALENTIAESNK